MMNETVLSRSLRMIFTGSAAVGMTMFAAQAMAQTPAPDSVIQRVEITGSSIKRIAAEGALPVQTLTRAQIEQALYGWGDEVESNAIEVHIHHLRRKLQADVIQTVRGVGYLLNTQAGV